MAALCSDRTAHAYLFSGPRGCGKTTSARILARCLNCVHGPTDTPCGECESCTELSATGSGSLDVVEMDAASHGNVEDARALVERASFAPARDRYKIFIVDEAHMVTNQGFNALLKLVEEPPDHVKFIFATTEPEKVIPTIRSRTHHYPFRLVPPEILEHYMAELCAQEDVEVGEGVLPLVVRAGGGSVRDSLSVLDQLIGGSDTASVSYESAVALLGFTDSALLDEAIDAIAAGDGAALFGVVERLIQSGHAPRRFVEDLLQRMRDIVILGLVGRSGADVFTSVPADQLNRMAAQADALGARRASEAADLVNETLSSMVGATSPRLQLELLCARLLVPHDAGGSAGHRDSRAGGGVFPGDPLSRSERQAAQEMAAEARARFSGGRQSAPPAVASASVNPPAQPAAPAPKATPAPQAVPEPSAGVGADSFNTGADWGLPVDMSEAAWPAPPVEPAANGDASGAAAHSGTPVAESETPALTAPASKAGTAGAASDASGSDSASEIRARWSEVIEHLKNSGERSAGTLLGDYAEVGVFEGGELCLHFANENMVGAGRRYAPALAQALTQVLGIEATIRCLAGNTPPPKAEAASEPASSGAVIAEESAPPVNEPAAASAPSVPTPEPPAEPAADYSDYSPFAVLDIPDSGAGEAGAASAQAAGAGASDSAAAKAVEGGRAEAADSLDDNGIDEAHLVSDDDPEIAQSSVVGLNVVLEHLGGTVIDEIKEDQGKGR